MGLRRHVPPLELDVHLRPGLPGRAHRTGARARAGLLQLRRPLRRRRRRRRPVEARLARLTDEQWQFRRKGRKGGFLRDARTTAPASPASSTAPASSSTAPASPRGAGCALHHGRARRRRAAASTGSPTCAGSCRCGSGAHRRARPRDLHAARVEAARLGRGRLEFHWWCTEAPDAFVGRDAGLPTLRDEIVELVGEPVYDLLVAQLDAAGGARCCPTPPSRRGRGRTPHRRDARCRS